MACVEDREKVNRLEPQISLQGWETYFDKICTRSHPSILDGSGMDTSEHLGKITVTLQSILMGWEPRQALFCLD